MEIRAQRAAEAALFYSCVCGFSEAFQSVPFLRLSKHLPLGYRYTGPCSDLPGIL